MGMLPPVVATLLADTKEYQAKMAEADGSMKTFGATSEATSTKAIASWNRMSTAVLGAGVAIGGYALDAAYKYQEAIDRMANLTGMTKTQTDALGKSFLIMSNATTVSAANLSAAYTTIYQSGMRGAKAQTALLDSAKLSVITNTDLATTTQALVAVENSHVAAGMSMNQITGKLIESQHRYAGSMTTMANLLSGRVGVALASAGVGLNNLLGVGDALSSVLGPKGSRSLTSFATSLQKFYAPMHVLHVTTKKTYETLSTYALALGTVGLSQQKLASDMQSSGGIVSVLKYLNDVSQQTHESLRTLVTTAFGSGAAPIVLQLLASMPKVTAAQQAVTKAGGGTLETGWKKVQGQLGFQLHDLATKLQNLAIVAGNQLLPAFTKLVGGATGLLAYLGKNKGASGALGGAAEGLLAAALGTKLATLGASIAVKFGADAATAEIAGPIGAAIGLAIFEFVKIGGAQNFADLITGHGKGGRKKASENILGAFWDANLAGIESIVKAVVTGNPSQLGKPQNIPNWALYHQAPTKHQMPHHGPHHGLDTGRANWHVRFTR